MKSPLMVIFSSRTPGYRTGRRIPCWRADAGPTTAAGEPCGKDGEPQRGAGKGDVQGFHVLDTFDGNIFDATI